MMGTNRLVYPTQSLSDAMMRLLDAFCILGALFYAGEGSLSLQSAFFWLVGGVSVALFHTVGAFCGMYRDWRGAAVERETTCALVTWIITLTSLLAIGYSTGHLIEFSRRMSLIWFFAGGLFIATTRIAVRVLQRTLRSHGLNTRRCAIVGVNPLAFQLARNVEQAPELGLKVTGFFDDRPEERTPELPVDIGRRIGDLDEMVTAARDGAIDTIYITFPMRAEDRIRGVLEKLGDTTATVYIVPDFFVFELLHARWTNIGGLPAVSIFENPFYGVDGLVKRSFDLLLATFVLAAMALPMAVIAMLVKRSSPGPVFFRQKRYGLDGREIRVWKFRSMKVCEDGGQVRQATQNDDRVTTIGKWLRRMSLDEVPQLFNVITGSMSLIGPRPHATAHNEHYRKMIQGYMLRHKVRPGITGLAQVNGCRGETETIEKMQQRVEFDHRYIREWSIWLDFKILFLTIFVVLSRQDAY